MSFRFGSQKLKEQIANIYPFLQLLVRLSSADPKRISRSKSREDTVVVDYVVSASAATFSKKPILCTVRRDRKDIYLGAGLILREGQPPSLGQAGWRQVCGTARLTTLEYTSSAKHFKHRFLLKTSKVDANLRLFLRAKLDVTRR